MTLVSRDSHRLRRLPAIARVEAHVLRWPVRVPVRTSFGVMHDRPGGARSRRGRRRRARLGRGVVQLPGVRRRAPRAPDRDRARAARRRPHVRVAARGISRALGANRGAGDPVGRARADRAGDRRRRHRAARPRGAARRRAAVAPSSRRRRRASRAAATREVPVYASGINPERPGDVVAALREAGHTAFKLKVGFGEARDLDNLAAVRAAAGAGADVMVDANQALGPRRARSRWADVSPSSPRAGSRSRCAPIGRGPNGSVWPRRAPIPLAAGENAIGADAFDALIASRAVAVVQPDVAKWGGVSGDARCHRPHRCGGPALLPALPRRRRSACSPPRMCSPRMRADDGWLEVDSNENPLRNALCPPLATLARRARSRSTSAAGLGVEPDLEELRALCRAQA